MALAWIKNAPNLEEFKGGFLALKSGFLGTQKWLLGPQNSAISRHIDLKFYFYWIYLCQPRPLSPPAWLAVDPCPREFH